MFLFAVYRLVFFKYRTLKSIGILTCCCGLRCWPGQGCVWRENLL